ncbi:hypothetical protein [Pontibacter litorisediminis]|uniref:hypothetical protein n=1 Tax=Pontibacter litorisediminis TaxID=1846260 RepID=UPI0023EBD5BE|nr:hypothetical protein [Pontibacter litorisediminis]
MKLKKGNGDVFFEASRSPGNVYIFVNWIGIQSLETVMMGNNQILAMLREKPCKGLLNSNRELIGPWDVAVNWLAYRWAPQAKALGLQHLAHVLSPGIYGQRSFKALYPNIKEQLDVKSFEDEKAAEAWLQLVAPQ